MKRNLIVAILGTFVLLALAAACAAPAPTPTPTKPPPTATPTLPPATPTTVPATLGKMLYEQKCAACHGLNAQGTAAAPAIAGHSAASTKIKVRAPMGTMPAFAAAALSDSDLEKIAQYLAGLGQAVAPVKEWEKAAPETTHHWMALLAIKTGDLQDARHHLQDALAFVKEPKHKAEMEKALALIAQGNIHDAEHEIEEMAGATAPSGVTMQRFHLILAQRALETKDAAEVKHHSEHFLVKAPEKEKAVVRRLLDLVAKGDFHEAEHEIEELLKG